MKSTVKGRDVLITRNYRVNAVQQYSKTDYAPIFMLTFVLIVLDYGADAVGALEISKVVKGTQIFKVLLIYHGTQVY